MKYFKIIFLIFTAVFLSACSNDEQPSNGNVSDEEVDFENKFSEKYGSWDDFCKIRPECDDYPYGYETVIIHNTPYYFPIRFFPSGIINSSGIPNHQNSRNSNHNFIHLSNDRKSVLRIASLDKESRQLEALKTTDHTLNFSWSGGGLNHLFKDLNLKVSDDGGATWRGFHGGEHGTFWVRKDGKNFTSSWIQNYYKDYIDENIIKEIENYQVGSFHDYDENFWFIGYFKSVSERKRASSTFYPGSQRFISKSPIFFGQRLYLHCRSLGCSARAFNLPSDMKESELPNVGFNPPKFVLNKVKGLTFECRSDHIDSCKPKKGLLDSSLEHLEKIEKIYEFISTKPEARD